jgi:fused signal recognition particle receptor
MNKSNNGKTSQDAAELQEKGSELVSQVNAMLGGSSALPEDVTSLLSSAQSSKSKAEETVADAQIEILKAIEARRDRVQEQTNALIAKAEAAREEAARAAAETERSRREAEKAKVEADEYLAMKKAEAKKEASATQEKAVREAEHGANAIREEAIAEAKRTKEHLAALRVAHQEELEAQRLLTKAAQIRARYSSVLEEDLVTPTQTISSPSLSGDESPAMDQKPISSVAQQPKSKQTKG